MSATGILLGRHVVRPLAAMSQAARNLAVQEGPTPLPTARVREVADVASALNTAAGQLHEARAQRAELEDQRRLFIGAIAHDLRTPLFTGFLRGCPGLQAGEESESCGAGQG
ncbi:HAMP domain-containing protein [Streptomyces sp. RB17]|uniref:HAMP domain-containing protein n=1 Tax=Streptomyces sp. RB17 TaxID=2585197 RepID=UPI003A4C842A